MSAVVVGIEEHGGEGGERERWFGDEGEKPEESESSEGCLQGPAGSYVYQGCSHLGAPMGGFSGSGQCPPVTLNHPAVQSGPRQVRMRPQDAPLISATCATQPTCYPSVLSLSLSLSLSLLCLSVSFLPLVAIYRLRHIHLHVLRTHSLYRRTNQQVSVF